MPPWPHARQQRPAIFQPGFQLANSVWLPGSSRLRKHQVVSGHEDPAALTVRVRGSSLYQTRRLFTGTVNDPARKLASIAIGDTHHILRSKLLLHAHNTRREQARLTSHDRRPRSLINDQPATHARYKGNPTPSTSRHDRRQTVPRQLPSIRP